VKRIKIASNQNMKLCLFCFVNYKARYPHGDSEKHGGEKTSGWLPGNKDIINIIIRWRV
jgi:hypothetical protein